MTEEIFLKDLEEYLRGDLPSHEVVKNMQYYRDYISTSKSMKSEAEVMKGLGEPRLIAKTIIDTYHISHDTKQKNSRKDDYQSDNVGENYHGKEVKRGEKQLNSGFKIFQRSGRLTVIVSFVILFLILGIFFWVSGVILKLLIRFVLPIIIILIGVSWIRRLFRK